MEWKKSRLAKTTWHRWFAWRPVCLTQFVPQSEQYEAGVFYWDEYVWLQIIERRIGWQQNPQGVTISYRWGAQYRRIS